MRHLPPWLKRLCACCPLYIAAVVMLAACNEAPTHPLLSRVPKLTTPVSDYQCPYWDAYYDCGGLPTFYPDIGYDNPSQPSGWCEYADANCWLRNAYYSEIQELQNESIRLMSHPSPFCEEMSLRMGFYLTFRDDWTPRIRFWDNAIRTYNSTYNKWGYLVGDIHYGDWDPWRGEIHIQSGQTYAGIRETFRHEVAHGMGLPDPPPTGSTYTGSDPWNMDAYQAASYCK
jgi:hypothetical protein